MDRALSEGFPLSPEPAMRINETPVGNKTLLSHPITRVEYGEVVWLPGSPEVVAFNEAAERLKSAVHLSTLIDEVIVFRDKNAPAPFPFSLPGGKAEYDYGAWHLQANGKTARATWYGGYSAQAPWIFTMGSSRNGMPEWDVVGHPQELHPLYAQGSRHVSLWQAYTDLLTRLEYTLTAFDLGFDLPLGGQALTLAADGTTLIFHHKRPQVWRITEAGVFYADGGGAPWTEVETPSFDILASTWGVTAATPTKSPAAPAWEVADAADQENLLAIPEKTEAKSLLVLVEVDGETIVYSEDGEIDYDVLSEMTNWTIYSV